MYLVPSTRPGPKSDERTCWVKWTGHRAKFQQAFLSANQTLPHLTLPYLILHLYLITLPYNNLTTKPYKPYKNPTTYLNLELFFWTLTYSLFCSIWCKTLFIVVAVVYKFCCTKSRSSPFFESCQPTPYSYWSTVYSFAKCRNKPGFFGACKNPHTIASWSHQSVSEWMRLFNSRN